jgi:hypothetical protein
MEALFAAYPRNLKLPATGPALFPVCPPETMQGVLKERRLSTSEDPSWPEGNGGHTIVRSREG